MPNGVVRNKIESEKDLTKIETNKSDKVQGRPYECIEVQSDGKLAWVVVVASFITNLIIDGFLYAFGAFSEKLKAYFHAQEWAVSMIISIACGFYMLSAPIASKLCDRYGCGLVGISGSILASAAIAISVFSPNIYVMWVSFGVFGGIGMGFVYLPSILIVGYCFENKRAIATGIVTAGTGIGSITFGPFSSFLFHIFGWKAALLILGSILLLCAVCSAIIVPLKPALQNDDIGSFELSEIAVDAPLLDGTASNGKDTTSTQDEVPKSRSNLSNILHKDVEYSQSQISIATSQVLKKPTMTLGGSMHTLSNHDDLLPNTLPVLLRSKSHLVINQGTQTDPVKFADELSLCRSEEDQAKRNLKINMALIYLGNICSMIGYYTPYLFVVKYAVTERNISEERAVFLLSIIGFSNTIARFLSGWVSKLPYMTSIRLNNIGLVIAGISTILVPFSSTHTHLIVYCIIWGAFIAFHVSMSPVIVCELVGLNKFSKALGMTLMFRGFTSFVAPPAMGGIRDLTSSFKIAFIIGGISFLVSAALHSVLRTNEDDADDGFNDIHDETQNQ